MPSDTIVVRFKFVIRGLKGPINQMTVNRYQEGGHLKPHIDLMQFKDGIFILRLESAAIMTFELGHLLHHCQLAAGDLLVLQGDAR